MLGVTLSWQGICLVGWQAGWMYRPTLPCTAPCRFLEHPWMIPYRTSPRFRAFTSCYHNLRNWESKSKHIHRVLLSDATQPIFQITKHQLPWQIISKNNGTVQLGILSKLLKTGDLPPSDGDMHRNSALFVPGQMRFPTYKFPLLLGDEGMPGRSSCGTQLTVWLRDSSKEMQEVWQLPGTILDEKAVTSMDNTNTHRTAMHDRPQPPHDIDQTRAPRPKTHHHLSWHWRCSCPELSAISYHPMSMQRAAQARRLTLCTAALTRLGIKATTKTNDQWLRHSPATPSAPTHQLPALPAFFKPTPTRTPSTSPSCKYHTWSSAFWQLHVSNATDDDNQSPHTSRGTLHPYSSNTSACPNQNNSQKKLTMAR